MQVDKVYTGKPNILITLTHEEALLLLEELNQYPSRVAVWGLWKMVREATKE